MLSPKIKRDLFNELAKRNDLFGIYTDVDGPLTFLVKIWPLREMSSMDPRFRNAYDDARQHFVNNNDWTTEYLFIDRFNLIEGEEEKYKLFLEACVSPDVRGTKDSILLYVNIINRFLVQTEHKLILSDYFEELPVYKVKDRDKYNDLPLNITANNIPFFLGTQAIDEYPCFVLIFDKWNDYNIQTQMLMAYNKSSGNQVVIGAIKIMKRGEKVTWDTLPKKFVTLNSEYCSLGQEEKFYFTMRDILPNIYQSVLLGLRDVALFPRIAEEFENDDIFKTSVIRFNQNELVMRTIRFKLNSIELFDAFKFTYTIQLPYAENEISVNFDFNYEGDLQHRIIAIIGKNGTGKTRIMAAIANSLSEDEPQNIHPKKPLYGKIFSVSYSFFDRFQIPDANASFNYVYCGLKKKDGSWLTEDDLIARFSEAVEKIIHKKLVKIWYDILVNFIPKEIVDEMFEQIEFDIKYKEDGFFSVYRKVSSGQNILLFIITEILAQIRKNSLILYDEPETHLHPNAISQLMNTIFALVTQFESFCIIGTHSPLVLQEIPSRDIYVLVREQNFASVRRLEKETFAENLTVITDDVFGNREISKHHLALLESLVNNNKGFEEIVSLFEYDNLPLNLSARLYIKNLIAQKNEKP